MIHFFWDSSLAVRVILFVCLMLYVDGALSGYATLSGSEVDYAYGSMPWRIGIADPFASQGGLFGDVTVDDVRIYARGLDTVEIENLNGVQIQN